MKNTKEEKVVNIGEDGAAPRWHEKAHTAAFDGALSPSEKSGKDTCSKCIRLFYEED